MHEVADFDEAEFDRHAKERAIVDSPTVVVEVGVVVGIDVQQSELLRSVLARQRRDESVRLHVAAAHADRNAAGVEDLGEHRVDLLE